MSEGCLGEFTSPHQLTGGVLPVYSLTQTTTSIFAVSSPTLVQ